LNILNLSFTILNRYFENRNLNLKLILSRYLKKHPNLSSNEITRTVYGIVRNEKLIEYIASSFAKRKLSQTDFKTKILLLIGIYLIHFSESYPGYAVVNEVVSIAPRHSRGFLNAILRKISSHSKDIALVVNNIKDPLIKHSISEYILKSLEFIVPNIDGVLEYLNSEPVFQIRINSSKPTLEDSIKKFNANGIKYKLLEKINSFEIENAGEVVKKILPTKSVYFQNSGSYCVSYLASKFSKNRVLDCCAAPGTKSITLSLLRPDIKIVSSDINPKRLDMFKAFLGKSTNPNIDIVAGDINAPPFQNRFDTVIIDAPCSSAGTLRKNPDLKMKLNQEIIKKNSDKQLKILCSVLSWADLDTTIIYSVCSFIMEETESVLKKCINATGKENVEILEIGNTVSSHGFNIRRGEFGIFLLPDAKLNNDLFYISAIRKKH